MATFTDSKTGQFSSSNKDIKKCVINEYLGARIEKFLGLKAGQILDTTNIQVNIPYNNDEGQIIKEYEIVKALRIDLQIKQTHNGHDYATWQVQWGTGMNETGGAYAGVLMRTGVPFTFAEFKEAMSKSFQYGHYCLLDP